MKCVYLSMKDYMNKWKDNQILRSIDYIQSRTQTNSCSCRNSHGRCSGCEGDLHGAIISQGWVFPHLPPPTAESANKAVTNLEQIKNITVLEWDFTGIDHNSKPFVQELQCIDFLLELTVEILNVIQKLSALVKDKQIYCKDASRSNLMVSLKRNWGIPFALIIKQHGNHRAAVDKKINTSDWNYTLKWFRLNKTFQAQANKINVSEDIYDFLEGYNGQKSPPKLQNSKENLDSKVFSLKSFQTTNVLSMKLLRSADSSTASKSAINRSNRTLTLLQEQIQDTWEY